MKSLRPGPCCVSVHRILSVSRDDTSLLIMWCRALSIESSKFDRFGGHLTIHVLSSSSSFRGSKFSYEHQRNKLVWITFIPGCRYRIRSSHDPFADQIMYVRESQSLSRPVNARHYRQRWHL